MIAVLPCKSLSPSARRRCLFRTRASRGRAPGAGTRKFWDSQPFDADGIGIEAVPPAPGTGGTGDWRWLSVLGLMRSLLAGLAAGHARQDARHEGVHGDAGKPRLQQVALHLAFGVGEAGAALHR